MISNQVFFLAMWIISFFLFQFNHNSLTGTIWILVLSIGITLSQTPTCYDSTTVTIIIPQTASFNLTAYLTSDGAVNNQANLFPITTVYGLNWTISQNLCPMNTCEICSLNVFPDVIPFYNSIGWTTDCSNVNNIYSNWCQNDFNRCSEVFDNQCANQCIGNTTSGNTVTNSATTESLTSGNI